MRSRPTPFQVSLASIAACWAVGCGAEAPAERLTDSELSIVGGDESNVGFDSTVGLVHASGASYAGVLVAPNLILLPKQAVNEVTNAPYVCDASGEPLEDGSGGGTVLAPRDAADLSVFVGPTHPFLQTQPVARGVQIFQDAALTLCSHDLAALLVEPPLLDVPFAPIRMPEQPIVDESVTVVGYGDTDHGPSDSRLGRPGVAVTAVGALTAEPGATGAVTPRTFETGPVLCFGDSGSPAYAETGAVVGIGVRALGIIYGIEQPCSASTVTSVFMQIAGFEKLLMEAFAAAGQEPWYEGGPHPSLAKFGEQCAADADCRSGVCYAGAPDEPVCNLGCSQDSDCPEDLVCRSVEQGPLCLMPEAPPPAAASASGCSAARPGSSIGLAWALGLFASLVLRRRRA